MSHQSEWLSLSKAASRLGVHPSTLRRWEDQGQIPSMRTVGGHRRFATPDLEAFQRGRHKLRVIGGLERGMANQALARTRREVISRDSWPEELEAADREVFRVSGRVLLDLTIQYGSLIKGGESLLRQAERIAREYASQGRSLGLSLPELLQLLLFFRDHIMEAAINLPQTDRLRPEANQRLFRRMNDVQNAFQLAVVEAFVQDQEDGPGPE